MVPLGLLYASLRRYPALKEVSFEWLKNAMKSLPEDDETETQDNKRKKWVSYERLCEIPRLLREDAAKRLKKGTKRYAEAMRNALLIEWLLVLPWRQRNLREMRLGDRAAGANIFRDRVSDEPTLARPASVEAAVKQNGDDDFWHFYFRASETKNKHAVHGLLLKQLVERLEEYLKEYRPLLINGSDPGTVFVDGQGHPFSARSLRYLVINIAVRYVGRRVNPHLFRDIFAVAYLADRPEDYLTLAKILWHRDVKTTIRLYGRNFDESHGARRAEDWLEERTKRKK